LKLKVNSAAQGGSAVDDPAIPPDAKGFIITLSVTTPHSLGFEYVLDSLIPNLQKFDQTAMTKWNAENPKQQRNFYIAKVSAPMKPVQIENDSQRVSALQTAYATIQALEGSKPGDQSAPPAPNYAQPPRPFYGGGFRPGGPRYSPGGGGYGGGAAESAPPSNVDSAVFMDRLTKEDRREDWEMQVMLVVVIDPPPAAPTPPS
jgi:hypothetical protein